MKKLSEPIVFFGSGPVAAESLTLLSKDFKIEAVVTKPRPLHHKGDVPVIRVAMELGLPLLYATDQQELDELLHNTSLQSRLAILIDFGIIVSQSVIDYFPLGIVNSHFSLLPEWRGADPITFSILSGQKKTGVSLMLLSEGLDEGPILAQTALDISPDATIIDLTHTLTLMSYHALCEVVPLYASGAVLPVDQESSILEDKQPTYSRKLTKEDGLIDWNKPAEQLEREIRAFLEWPKSHTQLGGIDVIITKAHIIAGSKGIPGTTALVHKQAAVYCGKDILVIDKLKPAGKNEMSGQAFLAGYRKLFLG